MPDDPLKIDTIASPEAEEINHFLQKHGFSIELSPFPTPPPPRFGVASVMDILVEWPEKGKTQSFGAADKKTYPGVKMNNSLAFTADQREPVIYLKTKNPDYQVGMVIPDKPIQDDFDLIDFVRTRKKVLGDRRQMIDRFNLDYQGVIFPKISLDQEPNISWLQGMWTNGHYQEVFGPSVIEQALQQTKFKMNEIGARAKSAVAFRVATLGGPPREPEPYIIDKPFVCWIERQNISVPLFAAYIQYSDWKDPESL